MAAPLNISVILACTGIMSKTAVTGIKKKIISNYVWKQQVTDKENMPL